MCYETTRNAKTCRSRGVGTPCFVDVRQLVMSYHQDNRTTRGNEWWWFQFTPQFPTKTILLEKETKPQNDFGTKKCHEGHPYTQTTWLGPGVGRTQPKGRKTPKFILRHKNVSRDILVLKFSGLETTCVFQNSFPFLPLLIYVEPKPFKLWAKERFCIYLGKRTLLHLNICSMMDIINFLRDAIPFGCLNFSRTA